MLAAAGLCAAFAWDGEDALTIDLPMSDPELLAVARGELGGIPVLAGYEGVTAVTYELRRAGEPPPLSPFNRPSEPPERVAAIVATESETLEDVLAANGLGPAADSPPRRVADFRWVDVYEVELERPPAG